MKSVRILGDIFAAVPVEGEIPTPEATQTAFDTAFEDAIKFKEARIRRLAEGVLLVDAGCAGVYFPSIGAHNQAIRLTPESEEEVISQIRQARPDFK